MKSSAATYLYRLAHAKTDQTGAQNNPNSDKLIVGPAAEALAAAMRMKTTT